MGKEPRPPAVAGVFYPDKKESLAELLDRLAPPAKQKQKAVAAIVPHGSLFTSGPVAGAVYSRLAPAPLAVLFGPNHSGSGEKLSVADGEWSTPLGEVSVDKELMRAVLKAAPDLKRDADAQKHEHAVELQLPFLQHFWKLKSFLPLAISNVDLESARQVGLAVAQALRKTGKQAVLIASTNLTRYELRDRAERADRQLIDRMTALDEKGLMEFAAQSGSSICGAPAVTAALAASKALGASRGALVKYEVVGVSSDAASAVSGYAGILVE